MENKSNAAVYSKEEIEEKFGTEELPTLIDLFEEIKNDELMAGRPFYIDYDTALIISTDKWKERVGGIPQGTFLLAFYEEEESFVEALLLRVIKPTKLPAEDDVISAIIDYYKDDRETVGSKTEIDAITRGELSFSGLECRILGTFYKEDEEVIFGADIENYYSAYNYRVFKLTGNALKSVVNGEKKDFKIGKVRYSSTKRFKNPDDEVPVYINPEDFLGKRTALFGMTRTGKSNTVKKIIELTTEISRKYENDRKTDRGISDKKLQDYEGIPKLPIGQIIFDVNGEYANPNDQDKGTAVYELFEEDKLVQRWSVFPKEGDFKVMKTNFYEDIEEGFEFIRDQLLGENARFITQFTSVDLSKPENMNDRSAVTRWQRRVAAYRCCLYRAEFEVPEEYKYLKFPGRAKINTIVKDVEGREIAPNDKTGIPIEDAVIWFSRVWENYNNEFFTEYRKDHSKEWASESFKFLLEFLTRKRFPKPSKTDPETYKKPDHAGYRMLAGVKEFHTAKGGAYQEKIIDSLRDGKIVLVDLSQGNPLIQSHYSEQLCEKIFKDAIDNFIKNETNNIIQFYFEEAHNLFPKQRETDLLQIYNRIAKEGAKLNLGIIYATQEVSSISANILKNTQNWFISHLNNKEELAQLEKYYDFEDFTRNLTRFSPSKDKGFVRMKVYSNPFVVPVQIDEFKVKK